MWLPCRVRSRSLSLAELSSGRVGRLSTGDGDVRLPDLEPVVQVLPEVADLRLVVVAEDHFLLLLCLQPALDQRQVDRVLLEDLGGGTQLGGERPVVIGAELGDARRSWPLRLIPARHEHHHFEDALVGIVAVRSEAVKERVEHSPW